MHAVHPQRNSSLCCLHQGVGDLICPAIRKAKQADEANYLSFFAMGPDRIGAHYSSVNKWKLGAEQQLPSVIGLWGQALQCATKGPAEAVRQVGQILHQRSCCET